MLGSSHPTPAQWQIVSESGSDLKRSDLINRSHNEHNDTENEYRSHNRFSVEKVGPDSSEADAA